jgi:hypothetical protein
VPVFAPDNAVLFCRSCQFCRRQKTIKLAEIAGISVKEQKRTAQEERITKPLLYR